MTDPGPPSPGDAAPEPLHQRTAWHPLLVMLLEMLLPRERWRVQAEFPLTREPRRIDVVVVRQIAEGAWRPQHLRSVLDGLRAHNVVHFKGATDDLESSDALQLLSYAYQYMALEGIKHPDALALRVVAPRLTPRFREQLLLLGGELRETAVAWPAPGEHLLYPISPGYLKRPVCPVAFDDTEWALYYRLA